MKSSLLLDIPTQNNSKLSYQEIRFIDEYMLDGNGTQAVIRAGIEDDPKKAKGVSTRLLKKTPVIAEIQRRSDAITGNSIMSAQEIMEFLTKVVRGEVTDQFGLDPSLKDRLAALKELKSIQIDAVNKNKEQDNTLKIEIIR